MRFFESNGYEFTAKVKFSEYFDFVAVHKTDPLEMVQIIHGSGLSTSVQRVSSEMIIQKLLVLL